MDSALPPGFQNTVWARIDRQLASKPAAPVADWFNRLVARPQLAAACAAMLILLGTAAGWTQGRKEAARLQHDLEQQYVQTVNPYHAARR